MPVLAEQRDVPRVRGGRRFLWLLVLPLLLVGLLLAPTVHPVVLTVGDRCLIVEEIRGERSWGWQVTENFGDGPPPGLMNYGKIGRWQVTKSGRMGLVDFGRWVYQVHWFRGHRVPQIERGDPAPVAGLQRT